ncbi:MAG: heparinase II/III family protein, partial [Myxococcales bacterium]|nr:heparinase II/III family protein [Myxococcales bacterium]
SWVAPGATNDWHRALPGADRWPLAPAETLGVGAEVPLGDVRLAWEVGRCTHLVRLAQAGWLSGERRYAEAALAGLHDFTAENPPGRGIAWLHAQEVALRAIAWVWVMRLAIPVVDVDGETLALWLSQLQRHCEFVEAFLTDGPVTHNHLVSEASGLFLVGGAVPELRGAKGWRRRGAQLLWREVEKQIGEDGVSAEGSSHYHAFVLDSLIAAFLLARAIGEPVPDEVRERVAAMADFVKWWIRSDGTLPAIGDSDAGRAWRLGVQPLDRRDLLAAAAVALERPEWGAVSGDAPGAFWLTGGRLVPGAGSPGSPGGARAYRSAGLVIARTDHGDEAEIFHMRAGPPRFRPDVLTSHFHADALAVGLRVGKDDVLIDPGTYLYSEGEGWRARFRHTSSHCCVTVDGADQADVSSHRFGITGLLSSGPLGFDGNSEQATIQAVHPAEGAVRVSRRVAWMQGGTLVLCDDVLGSGEHEVDVWFQVPASEGEPSGPRVEMRLESGRVVEIDALLGARRIRLDRACTPPGAGWRAPRYGSREPATRVRVSAGRVSLPHRVVTLVRTTLQGSVSRAPECDVVSGAVCVRVSGHAVTFPSAGGVSIELRPELGVSA